MLDFRILGTFEVLEDDQPLTLGSPRQRALLAILVLGRGAVLSSDRLIDELWGDRPPSSAIKIVQGYVSQLRKIVGEGTLVTRPGGYQLAMERDQLDADRFRRMAHAGREALAAGDPAVAVELFASGLSLWRGDALAEFAYERFAQPEAARLEEERLGVLEDRIDAELALGRHREIAAELEDLRSRNPYRERLLSQLMVALYRDGRQAEALEAYRCGRQTLGEELGLDPGPGLRALERQILDQDPALDPPARPSSDTATHPPVSVARGRPRGHWLVMSAGMLLLAAAVAAGVSELAGGHGSMVRATPNSVAAIDPRSNQVVATAEVGAAPGAIAYGNRSLWVVNVQDETISRLAATTLQTQATVRLSQQPTGIAATDGAMWVAMSNPTQDFITASRVDPQFDDVDRTVTVGNVDPATAPSIAADGDAVWVAPQSGALTQLNSETGRVLKRVEPNASPTDLTVGAGATWFTDAEAGDVVRVDPTGVRATFSVGDDPTGIAVGAGAVWVANTADNQVVRLNPSTGAPAGVIKVGDAPAGLAFGDGSVWVANSGDGTISRIDPRTDKVVARIPIGGSPHSLVFADGHVWATVDVLAVRTQTAAQGGTLRVDSAEDLDSTDPAVADSYVDWALLYASCAKLLNYPDLAGAAGSRLVPEVAKALPTVSQGGLTYTFTIRTGFRFAPPSNQVVTAQTFKDTIERTLNPVMKSPEASDFSEIVGAGAYIAGRARHISGVTASRDHLTIRLTRPNPVLPIQMALPFFCAVPPDTPIDPNGVGLIPSAGPYTVRSYSPDQGAVLVRNPNYHGARPHHFDRIDISPAVLGRTAIHAVESGAADVADEGEVSAANVRGITARYGPDSRAAKDGHQQAFVHSEPDLDFLALNTHRPLFSHERVREAVNYAINRGALARLGDQISDLPDAPFDHYLPPGVPGYRDFNAYPTSPDLARARELARGYAGASVVLYTCDYSPCVQQAQIVKTDLAAIDLRVRVKTLSLGALYSRTGHPGEPFDMADIGWTADYPEPYDFLNVLLEGGPPIPTLEDAKVRGQLASAARLSGTDRYLAYAKLDQQLTTVAPFVVWGNARSYDLFSARIGCETYSPVYGADLAALCLRRTGKARSTK